MNNVECASRVAGYFGMNAYGLFTTFDIVACSALWVKQVASASSKIFEKAVIVEKIAGDAASMLCIPVLLLCEVPSYFGRVHALLDGDSNTTLIHQILKIVRLLFSCIVLGSISILFLKEAALISLSSNVISLLELSSIAGSLSYDGLSLATTVAKLNKALFSYIPGKKERNNLKEGKQISKEESSVQFKKRVSKTICGGVAVVGSLGSLGYFLGFCGPLSLLSLMSVKLVAKVYYRVIKEGEGLNA